MRSAAKLGRVDGSSDDSDGCVTNKCRFDVDGRYEGTDLDVNSEDDDISGSLRRSISPLDLLYLLEELLLEVN